LNPDASLSAKKDAPESTIEEEKFPSTKAETVTTNGVSAGNKLISVFNLN
jgi:hypothetical protein